MFVIGDLIVYCSNPIKEAKMGESGLYCVNARAAATAILSGMCEFLYLQIVSVWTTQITIALHLPYVKAHKISSHDKQVSFPSKIVCRQKNKQKSLGMQ